MNPWDRPDRLPEEEDANRLYPEPDVVTMRTNRLRMAPAAVLGGLMVALALWQWWTVGDMVDWALSGPRLAAGRFETLLLHMFAHGGLVHLCFNTVALLAFTPPVMQRLGPPGGRAFAAYGALFLASGLAGAALWLAINPASMVPMLGASGAIFGLLGFILRQPDPYAPPAPLISAASRRAVWEWIKLHLILFAIVLGPSLLLGGQASFGLAWEAHLGGFIAGMLLCGPIGRWARAQEGIA